MITLEKWLAVNECAFAIPTFRKLYELKPLTYNAIISEDRAVCIYYQPPQAHIYFDVLVFPDGTFEWFWSNRITHEYDGSGEAHETEFSESFKERLRCLT